MVNPWLTHWPRNAYAGQRVVCIADFPRHPALTSHPEKGKVYTIREVRYHDEGIGLLLKEFVNPIKETTSGSVLETSFAALGFRPVDETKIDMFRQIAKNPKVPIPA